MSPRTFSPFLSSALGLTMSLVLTGCVSSPAPAPRGQELFAPTELHIQPVFTKVIDWTGDGRPDGVEALVELRDQFGDTTKGAGTFIFELYSFQSNNPDPRGPRVVNPWQAPVDTVDTQRQRWARTTRCYSFRLAFPNAKAGNSYVLAATFSPLGAPRLFDQVVLEGRVDPDR